MTVPAAAPEIDALVAQLLQNAEAAGRYPTPVDHLVASAGLTESDDYELDEAAIALLPPHLRALLRSARPKLLGLADRRERIIKVSPDVSHEGRRRFIKLHELAHHALPWQNALVYADDRESLSPGTRAQFEQEANYAAAGLLFQGPQFDGDLAGLPVRIDSVRMLCDLYGASFRATFRRFGERHPAPVAAVAFEAPNQEARLSVWRRLEVSTSPAWVQRFGVPRWPSSMSAARFRWLSVLDEGAEPGALKLAAHDGQLIQVEGTRLPRNSYVMLTVGS